LTSSRRSGAQRPKAKLLNPKEALKDSVMRRSYLFYSQLSSDAAHPSITALKRHMLRIKEEGGWVLGVGARNHRGPCSQTERIPARIS